MSTITECAVAVALLVGMSSALAADDGQRYDFGSTPNEQEMQRFFSSLPDGRDLPAGSGSAAQGRTLFAQQCSSCHGANLEGGIGDKLIGGRGTLVNDSPAKVPVKTVESYWPYATALFDYIKRAMPLAAPESLSNDQVYALCAYILAEAKIVPPDATLDKSSLPKVTMPNRGGFVSPDPRPEKFPPVANTPHQDLAVAPAPK